MKLKKIVFLFHLTSKSVEFIDLFNTPKVTYKGDRDIIKSNVAMLISDMALKIASFIMFQKICNYLSILSTVLVLGILGGGFFTFKYVTSEQFKAKKMNEIIGQANLIIGKQRHGPTGTVNVEFEGMYTKFKDAAKKYGVLRMKFELVK